MFIFHNRRFGHLNNLYLVICVFLAAGFLIQFKVLYHSHQKHLRLADYKDRINELSDNMKSVLRVANVTSDLMKRLQKKIMIS